MELLLPMRVFSSRLAPPLQHCHQLSVDAALSLLGKLVKVDALTPFAKSRGHDAYIFLFSLNQNIHFIELEWQVFKISHSEFANLYPVGVASTPFFHQIIRI